ncbi:MAG: hypothetical protein HOM84_08585 [Thiotrichales bacterium]|jgi:hypothetical protein|nr:hypothetical protein [Thiotrichales bacterium]MBT3752981.1 hypothetical protein [Thiotrichales bacterium]MBT3837468.1 hypothetical protein [Thiotrichales bacterium]MBT4152905.1 hypothetical protein [Thiotrichales bacterium]MBT4261751.1 hypothetical protein [Thiotrichales bacterium]
MLSLNYEVEINKDHRVELTFPESLSLGKYQLVVVVDKAVNHHNDAQDDSEALMALARQVLEILRILLHGRESSVPNGINSAFS